VKYFSIAYWSTYDPADDTERRYKSYVQSIRPQLPGPLQVFTGAGGPVSLNDTRLHRVSVNLEKRRAEIELRGEIKDGSKPQPNTSEWSIVACGIILRYEGVVAFSSRSDPEIGLAGPHGYGDHGFDEVELLAENLYEHRMLFSSGIEIAMRFTEFTAEYIGVAEATSGER